MFFVLPFILPNIPSSVKAAIVNIPSTTYGVSTSDEGCVWLHVCRPPPVEIMEGLRNPTLN